MAVEAGTVGEALVEADQQTSRRRMPFYYVLRKIYVRGPMMRPVSP